MSYDIEIIKKNKQKTSKWSGGTTTELYIYPADSLYNQRNFKWRLSSAKVDLECSTFTCLPGIYRHIMVLEGEILLEHKEHHNAMLKAFEQDRFSGDWTTKSFGKVIDFNLMLAQGYSGKLESIFLNSGEVKDICLHNNVDKFSQITDAFYIVKGDVELDMGGKGKINLSQGDLALLTNLEQETTSVLKISSGNQSELKIIIVSIFNCE